MRKELLTIGILSVFLTSMLIPVSHAFYVYNPPIPSGYCFSPVIAGNDAGYAYNLSGITFVTTLVNLTGTFSYNSSEGGIQTVAYYIALGQLIYSKQYGYTAYYIQPVIAFVTDGYSWSLEWVVQAWGNNSGSFYDEYNNSGLITYGYGSSVNLNYLFNLTIKATLNSQGEITSAWLYIANAKTGQVYFSQTITLQYPIVDKQVFFEVEDPLMESNTPYKFPIIPSSNYIFVKALASNNTNTYSGLPFYNGVCYIMEYPHAWASVTPTLWYSTGSQGVQYIW
jgi:hypothetical protein